MVNSVIFLVQRFPGFGGAEEYVFQLTKGLAANGVSCTIFTSDLDKRKVTGLPASVKVVKFPASIKFGEYALWKGLFKTLLSTKADILHVNTYGYYHTDLVSLLHGLKNFNVVLTSHGFHGLEASINQRKSDRGMVTLTRDLDYTMRPFFDYTFGFHEITSADALIALSEHDI